MRTIWKVFLARRKGYSAFAAIRDHTVDFQDLLEHSYLKLSTKEHRKTYAQFFTPPAIASLMAAYILDNKECSKILDPANGLTIFGRALDEHLKLINHRSFDSHYQILNTLSYSSWIDLSSRRTGRNLRASTRRSSLTSLFCNHTELHHILALSQVPLKVCLSGGTKDSHLDYGATQSQSLSQVQTLNQALEHEEQLKQRPHHKLQHESPCSDSVNADLSADFDSSQSVAKSQAVLKAAPASLSIVNTELGFNTHTQASNQSDQVAKDSYLTGDQDSYLPEAQDNYLPLEWFTNSPRFSLPKLELLKQASSKQEQSLSVRVMTMQPMSNKEDSTVYPHSALDSTQVTSDDDLGLTDKLHMASTDKQRLEMADQQHIAITDKQSRSLDLSSFSLVLNQQYGAFAELGRSIYSSAPIQSTHSALSLSAPLSLDSVAAIAGHNSLTGHDAASETSKDIRAHASTKQTISSQATTAIFQPIVSPADTLFALQPLRNNDLSTADIMLSRTEGTLLTHIWSESENTLLQSNLAFYTIEHDSPATTLDSESLIEKEAPKGLAEKAHCAALGTAETINASNIADLDNATSAYNSDLATVATSTIDASNTSEEILCISNVSDVPERKVELVAYEIDPIIAEFASLSATQIPMRFVDVDFRLKDYLKSNFKDRYDGIICNPPYKTFKEFARKSHFITLIEERLNLKLSGTTNLYALFLLKSLAQLKPNGRCAYLIPYEFLNSSFGIKIKEQFLKQRNLAYVITFDVKGSVFDNATTTCGLFLFDNSQEQKQVEFITLHTIDEIEQLMIRLCPNLIASYPETHRSFQRYVSALSTNRNAEQTGFKKSHSLLDDLMLSLDGMCPLPSNVQQALALAPSLVSALPNHMLYSLLSQAQAMRHQAQSAQVTTNLSLNTDRTGCAHTSQEMMHRKQDEQAEHVKSPFAETIEQPLLHTQCKLLEPSSLQKLSDYQAKVDGLPSQKELTNLQAKEDGVYELNELSALQSKEDGLREMQGDSTLQTEDNGQNEQINHQTQQSTLNAQVLPIKQDVNNLQSAQHDVQNSLAQIDSVGSTPSNLGCLALNGRIVPYAQLKAKQKWHVYYQSRKFTLQNPEAHLTSDSALTTFDQFIKVKRGLATGANEFFLFNRSKVAATKIPEQYFVKVIPRSNFIQRPIFTLQDFEQLEQQDAMVYLLNAPAQPDEPNLKKYLAYGESMDIHKRYLTRHRCPWYALERRQVAPILVSVFNRGSMQVVRNEAQIFNLTTFHSVFVLQKDKTELIFAYLLTDLAKEIILQNRREYGGGLEKLEPLDINHAACINFNQMPYADEQDVLQLYRKYRQQILHTNPNFKEASLLIEQMSAIFQHML